MPTLTLELFSADQDSALVRTRVYRSYGTLAIKNRAGERVETLHEGLRGGEFGPSQVCNPIFHPEFAIVTTGRCSSQFDKEFTKVWGYAQGRFGSYPIADAAKPAHARWKLQPSTCTHPLAIQRAP